MEINGRIGGEPVPAGGPTNTDELSPQEMQAIQEMMGMAEGGEVQNPYMQQQLLYSQPRPVSMDEQNKAIVDSINPVENQMPMQTMADGGQVQGYQDSSVVTDKTGQNYVQAGQQALNKGFVGFPLGSTIFPSEKTGQTVLQTADTDTSMLTTVTLYGPNGEIVTLTLPTDQARYDQLISEGYTTEMPVAGEPVVKGGDDDDDDDKPKTDPNAWMEKFSYDDFGKLGNETSDMLKKAPVGGAIGAFINGSTAAQAAANIIIMEANGQNVDSLKADWEKFVNSDLVLRNLPKELINGDRFAKDIVLNNRDIGLFKDSKDIFGNDIFKTDKDWNNFMNETSPEGMSYDPSSESYKADDDRDIGQILGGTQIGTSTGSDGTTVKVYKPGSGTVKPPSKPKPPTTSGSSGSSGSSGGSGQDNNPNVGAYSSNIASSGVSQATQTIQDSVQDKLDRDKAEADANVTFDASQNIGINKGGLMAVPKKKKKRQPKKGGLAGKK